MKADAEAERVDGCGAVDVEGPASVIGVVRHSGGATAREEGYMLVKELGKC